MRRLLTIFTNPIVMLEAEQEGAQVRAGDGEMPSLTVVADNVRGEHTTRFSPPPLGVAADFLTGGWKFRGRVRGVVLADGVVRVELEA